MAMYGHGYRQHGHGYRQHGHVYRQYGHGYRSMQKLTCQRLVPTILSTHICASFHIKLFLTL